MRYHPAGVSLSLRSCRGIAYALRYRLTSTEVRRAGDAIKGMYYTFLWLLVSLPPVHIANVVQVYMCYGLCFGISFWEYFVRFGGASVLLL